jgi:hypothetical protein
VLLHLPLQRPRRLLETPVRFLSVLSFCNASLTAYFSLVAPWVDDLKVETTFFGADLAEFLSLHFPSYLGLFEFAVVVRSRASESTPKGLRL